MNHDINVLRSAIADIDEKFEYLRRNFGQRSASRWRDRLDSRFSDLERRPEMWPLADEAADLGIELRETLFGKRRHVYRILFTIQGQTVYVHRVRHASQDRLTADDI